MIYIVLFFSFVLESILSNYLNGTFFSVLFVVSSLVFIFPLFYKNEKKYYLYAFSCGILYDFIFTNTIMFNGLIFLILAAIIIKSNVYFINSLINTILLTSFIVFCYLVISHIGLSISSYINFSAKEIIYVYTKNIISNVLFSSIFYILLEKISVKYKILKVN